jgi:hypothetical protein
LKINFNQLYEKFIIFYAFIFIFTPMGLLSTVKTILLMILIGLFSIRIQGHIKKNTLFIILIFILFILFNIFNSYFYGFYEKEVFFELKSIIGLFLSIVILIYSYSNKFVNNEKIVKTIVLSHILYLTVKMSLMFAFFFNIGFASVLIDALSNSLNVNIMAYGVLPKITLPNDILTPIVFLIILLNRSYLKSYFFKYKMDYFIIFICLISIVSTFNRFNIVILTFGLILFIIFIDIKKIFNIIVGLFVFLLILSYVDDSLLTVIIELWEYRLSGEGDLSTGEKTYQYLLFLERILNGNPLFGNGVGSFLYDYIRDDNIRYGYEAFIMLLIYQFGFIGMILLLFFYLLFYINHYNLLQNKYLLFHSILSLLLFSVSFVNPMVLNSMYAVAYSLIIGNFLYLNSIRRYNYDSTKK